MSTLPEENHIRILRENVEFISKETNLKSLLLEYLLQSKTITQCEFESIKQILDREGTTKAASALVTEHMMKKDSDAFINFIKALENDEQGHVAERLKNPDGPAIAEQKSQIQTAQVSISSKSGDQQKRDV